MFAEAASFHTRLHVYNLMSCMTGRCHGQESTAATLPAWHVYIADKRPNASQQPAPDLWLAAQAVEKLKLDTETPAAGTRPKGLGMVSCVGTEYVAFKSPLPLDNKVCSCGHLCSCTPAVTACLCTP